MTRPEPPTGAYVADRYCVKDAVWVYTSGELQFDFVWLGTDHIRQENGERVLSTEPLALARSTSMSRCKKRRRWSRSQKKIS